MSARTQPEIFIALPTRSEEEEEGSHALYILYIIYIIYSVYTILYISRPRPGGLSQHLTSLSGRISVQWRSSHRGSTLTTVWKLRGSGVYVSCSTIQCCFQLPLFDIEEIVCRVWISKNIDLWFNLLIVMKVFG